ncbi:hypothetical protein AVEN_64992-1 [Araneus ventricosus]|uniref:Uncharacterized protein n=1 Tax=Araneus ventricosus TaxID=182803 RepID=A0A4Y2UXU3_ARAVE|nr:hypothetical protein AVEN_241931-1 [Araneus ventricosus]GBO16442.1 hypothetical protein AVEN_64992-1 [Araneus ventricosus]
MIVTFHMWGRGGLVVRPLPWGRQTPGSKPDSTEDPPRMWAARTPNPTSWANPTTVARKLREGAPALVSSSSSYRSSKSRGPT